MEDREFEGMLEQLMKQDLAAGTEAFRDDLLARCLATLGSDGAGERDAEPEFHAFEVSDADLDLLAAAGEPVLPPSVQSIGDNANTED